MIATSRPALLATGSAFSMTQRTRSVRDHSKTNVAQADHIPVGEGLIAVYRLFVHACAVGAAQVGHEPLATEPTDASVDGRDGSIAHDHVGLGRPAERDPVM